MIVIPLLYVLKCICITTRNKKCWFSVSQSEFILSAHLVSHLILSFIACH